MAKEAPHDLGKLLFIDIETVPQAYRWADLDPADARLFAEKTRYDQERQGKGPEQLWLERGGILAEFGRIVCVGMGTLHSQDGGLALRVASYHGHDEYDILSRFAALLERRYAGKGHLLCAHNGKEFDFPWIARRCVVHRIPLPRLLDIGGLKPWEVGHVDTMQLWAFGDRKNFTSLALLTRILGIPTPKDDMSGADVAGVYHEERDLERIAAYCRKDVVATAQLYLRLTGRDLIPPERISMA